MANQYTADNGRFLLVHCCGGELDLIEAIKDFDPFQKMENLFDYVAIEKAIQAGWSAGMDRARKLKSAS